MKVATQRLLNLREAAERLDLTVSCLRAWQARRKITIIKLGKAVRISEAEVQRVIDEGTIPARAVQK